MKRGKKKKPKFSIVFFIIGGFLLFFLISLFASGVQQSALNINVGGEKGITIGATGISDTTLIIVFVVAMISLLIGFVIKLKFEK